MLFPAAKIGDGIIGADAHTILVPAPPSPSPVPVPLVPHPYIGNIFLWWTPKFPSMNVFVNGMPALTVGAKSLSFHIPTPPGVWWQKLPCAAKFFLAHYTTVALSTMFSLALNTAGAMTGTAVPTTRTPTSQMDPPPANPDLWGALSQQINSFNWGIIIKSLLPPVVLPIAEADINMGSPTVTVNGGPMAIVGPMFAASCSEIPIVPNASVLGYSNVMVGLTLKEILMQLAWNAVHGAAALGASRLGNRFAGRVTGEPIDIVSGANIVDPVDFQLPGPLPFSWIRHYSSLLVKDGPLGWCWSYEYHRVLDFEEEAIIFTDEEGRSHRFPRLNDDLSEFEIKIEGLKLRRIDDDHYEMKRRNEPTMLFAFNGFAPQALMTELREKNGNRILFKHNRQGQLIEIVHSTGLRLSLEYYSQKGKIRSISCTGNASNELSLSLLSFEYDDSGNLSSVVDAYGNLETYAYDDGHRITRKTDRRAYSFHYEYNEAGQCIKSWGDDGLYSVELEYYLGVGLTKVTEPSGGTYLYKYDEQSLVRGIVDPYGNAKIFDYDEYGNLVTETDENGNMTAYEYDVEGNRVKQEDSRKGTTTWEYDSNSNPLRMVSPDGAITQYMTDRLGNPIPTLSGDPTVEGLPIYEYDVLGRCIAVAVGGKRTKYDYDSLSRLWRVRHPDGSSESNTFDVEGNVLSYTDRLGHTWRYRYDSWNKLVEEIDPEGNCTCYAYNRWDAITRVEDANGNITEYGRDLCNRLVAVYQNGQLVERYMLDPAGKLLERQAPDGEPLLKITRGNGNVAQKKTFSSDQHITFEYDEASRIVEATGTDFAQQRAYDTAGRLALEEIDGWTLKQEYDEESGLFTKTTIGGEWTIARQLDPNTGVITLTDPLGNRYELEYKGRQLTCCRTSWGLKESFQVEDGRRLQHEIDGPAFFHRSIAYKHNPNGNLVCLNDSEIRTRWYTYDRAERLVGVSYPNARVDYYAYDPAGNLVSLPGYVPLMIGDGNRLQGWQGVSEQYDDRGNLIQRQTPAGTTRFYYNSYELLERVELPDGRVVYYRYDALRRRISKEIDGQTTEYLWEGDRLVAEKRQNESVRIYLYALPDDLVPRSFVDYRREEGEWKGTAYCIHTNHLYTPIVVTDETGNVVWSVELTPYGAIRKYHTAGLEFNLRLPGQYLDTETGLHYNRNRYYDPEIGRYIQPDPIGLAGGINTYAYPQNPLSNFDFLGLSNGCGDGSRVGDPGDEDTPDPRPRRVPTPQEQAGYPPRCADSDAAAQRVIDAINATERRARDRRVMVTALAHEDGHVSVGISGRNSQDLIDDVRGRLPSNYELHDATPSGLPAADDPANPGRQYSGGQNCSEPRAWNAANAYNDTRQAEGQPSSPVQGMTNQRNTVPTEARPEGNRGTRITYTPPDSDYADPCPSCSQNSQSIRRVALQGVDE